MIPKITGNPLIHVLSVLNTGEYWRYLIDARHQVRGRMGYAEENYIASLLQAVKFIMPFFAGRKLSVADIKQLHYVVMHTVTNTRYAREEDLETAVCRKEQDVGFTLTEHTASAAGFSALIDRLQTENPCYFSLMILNFSRGTEELISQENISDILLESSQDELILKLRDSYTNFRTTHFSQETPVSIEMLLGQLLQNYYDSIETATSDEKKLRIIAHFCQAAIQLHPFDDGNGRLFCMLIPQILCVQNNFPLPLLREVNMFVAFSVREIALGLEQGLQCTCQLLLGELPLGFSSYFDEAVEESMHYQLGLREVFESAATYDDMFIKIWVACRHQDVALLSSLPLAEVSFTADMYAIIQTTVEKYFSVSCFEFLKGTLGLPFDLSMCARFMDLLVRNDPAYAGMMDVFSVEDFHRIFVAAIALGNFESVRSLHDFGATKFDTEFNINFKDEKDRSALSEACRCNYSAIVQYLLAMGADKRITYLGRHIDLLAFNNRNEELIGILDLPFSSALSIFYGEEVSENTPALFDKLCERYPALMALVMSKECMDGMPFLVKLYDKVSIHIIYSLQTNRSLCHPLPEDCFTAERYLRLGSAIIKSVSGLELDKKEFLFGLLPDFCDGINKLHLLILADDEYFYKSFMSAEEDILVCLYQTYGDKFPLEMALDQKNFKLAKKILTYDVSYADVTLSRMITSVFENQYYLGLLLLFEKFFPLVEENIFPLIQIIIEDSDCYALFLKQSDQFYEDYPKSKAINHLVNSAIKDPVIFDKLCFLVSNKDLFFLLSRASNVYVHQKLAIMEKRSEQYSHIFSLHERIREDDGPCQSIRLAGYRNQLREFCALYQALLTYDVRSLMQRRFSGPAEEVSLHYGDVQELIVYREASQGPRYRPLTQFFSVCGAGDGRVRTLTASMRELRNFCEDRDPAAVISAEEISVLRDMVQREASLHLEDGASLQNFSVMPIFRQLDEILNLLYPTGIGIGPALTRGPGSGK